MITFSEYFREQNVAAAGGALGSWTSTGGAFPAAGDAGYNPGDYRALSPVGPAGAVLGAKISKKGKKKKTKFKIQRRTFAV
jgi:hypothetical protein